MYQAVNVGAAPNDNTGDALRNAFIKLNANDAELYTLVAGDAKNFTKNLHGFPVGQLVYFDGSGIPQALTNPSTQQVVGIVSAVADVNNFTLVFNGAITTLSGLTPGADYYIQPDGSLSTVVTDKKYLSALSATSAVVLSGGGGGHLIYNAGSPVTTRSKINIVNGLTAVDNNPYTDIKLGGVITENTYFDFGDTYQIDFDGVSSFNVLGGANVFGLNQSTNTIVLTTPSHELLLSPSNAYLRVSGTNLTLSSTNGDYVIEKFGTGVFQIADGRAGVNAVGIQYAADYSANFDTRSLIDKGYADGRYWSLASGGALTGNNTITMGAYSLTFTGALNISQPDATATNREFLITTRDVAIDFPATTIMPSTSNTVMAFDIMPKGAGVVETANGFSWIDVCSADILNNNNPVTTARVGIKSAGADFGSYSFNGATAIPLLLTINGTTGATLTTAGKFMFGTKTGAANWNVDIHQGSADAAVLGFSNTNTGTAITDGFNVGIDATGNAFLLQRESLDLQFWTAATQNVTIKSGGNFLIGSTSDNARLYVSQGVLSASWKPSLRIDPGAHTSMAAATEFVSNDFRGASQQWLAGTVATQRFNYFRGFTVTGASATATFTDLYNVYIDPVTVSTNATATRNWALGVGGNINIAAENSFIRFGTSGGNVGIRQESGIGMRIGGLSGGGGYVVKFVDNNDVSVYGTLTPNGGVGFAFGSTTLTNANYYLVQGALSSSWKPTFRVDPGAHTSMTAATEFVSNDFQGASQQWLAGTVATQRFNYFRSFTLTGVSATAIFTNAYTAYFDAPTFGANATGTAYSIGTNGNIQVGTTGTGIVYAGTVGTSAFAALNFYASGGQAGYFSNSGGFAVTTLASGTVARFLLQHINQTSSWYPALRVDAGAHTGQTASTEFIHADWRGASQQWLAGTVVTQRFNYFRGFTVTGASATATFSNIYTIYVDASTASTNATITNNWAAGFNGNVQLDGASRSLTVGTSGNSLLTIFGVGGALVTQAWQWYSNNGTMDLVIPRGATNLSLRVGSSSAQSLNTADFTAVQIGANLTAGPTSGTGTTIWSQVRPTHNYTGTWTGTVIGYDYNPIITSLTGTTNLAIRTTSGGVLLAGGLTTADAGATITANTKLDVRGIGTTTGYTFRLATSGNTEIFRAVDKGDFVFTQTAQSSGWSPIFTSTPGAHTSITNTAENINNDFSAVTQTWAGGGTVATQRGTYFRSQTLAGASAQTFTNAYTVYIDPPVQGSNATITNLFALGLSGGQYVNYNGLGTTQLNYGGIWLANNTAAAAGAQQISPSLTWEGQGWKTDATAASQSVRFTSYVSPAQSGPAPGGVWLLGYSINSGAYTSVLQVNSSGPYTQGIVVNPGSAAVSIASNAMSFSGASGATITIGGGALDLNVGGATSIRSNDVSSGAGTTGSISIYTGNGITSGDSSGNIFLNIGTSAGAGTRGNLGIFDTSTDFDGGQRVIRIGSRTAAPSGTIVADNAYLYVQDIVAGNAAPHIMTENGDIIKLYSISGWGTPTNTFDRTTFDTTTVTLAQLASRVGALISDLKTLHGLLKA
jgi:hypothetical protein